MLNLNQAIRGIATVSFVITSTLISTTVFSQTQKSGDMPPLSQEIEYIKAEQSAMKRYQRAQDLLDSVKQVGAQNITGSEIAEITGLLVNPDDPVRYWAAVTLGYIGPRAASAAPALEKALREEVCTMASKTSAHAVRDALEKIGVKPHLITCPIVANGYSNKASITLFNKGHSGISENVASGQCIEINPQDFVMTKLIVAPEHLPTRTYSTNEFRDAFSKIRDAKRDQQPTTPHEVSMSNSNVIGFGENIETMTYADGLAYIERSRRQLERFDVALPGDGERKLPAEDVAAIRRKLDALEAELLKGSGAI